jgi:uncharacterized protein (TIGR02996 family)
MSSPEAAFLEAVCADPAADGPRLIYADWLDEQGDPRGEFIRLQCALGRLAADDPLVRPLTLRLGTFGRYMSAWEAPLKPVVGGMEWARGFVETVNVEARTFLRRAAELFRLAPVRRVRFLDVGTSLGRLMESPYLARLTALTIFAQHTDERLTRALVESPYLDGLRTLNIARNRVGDRGAERLAWSPRFRHLTELDLSDNAVGDLGLRAVAGAANLENLEVLELRRNEVTRAGLGDLCSSPVLKSLRRLGLSLNYVGSPRDWTPPTAGVVSLRSLDLTDNVLSAEGVGVVISMPGLGDLTDLDLSRNDLGNAGAAILAGWPGLTSLRKLLLAETQIGDDGARALARSPYLFRLTDLNLSENPVHDPGAFEFLNSSTLLRLKRLGVPHLGMTPQMRRALAVRFPG